MYIRKTIAGRREDGTGYRRYRLVECTRIGDKVVQHTLLHLGVHFSIPQEKWRELTERVESILHHRSTLFPVDETIEAEAQSIASRLINKKKEYAPADRQTAEDYLSVDINSLQNSEPRSVGVEQMAYDALQSLKLDTKLKSLGLSNAELSAAIGAIIGRMAAPGSERSTLQWLQHNSALGELIGYDFNQCSASRIYKISDTLLKYRNELESYLFSRECTLFNLNCTITLYDLTNTFFEGSGKYNALSAFGRSKEKRSDSPLVTLALVLDGSGFPRSSRIFKGNVSEPVTLKEMVQSLTGNRTDPLIVMDAGIATRENLEWLKERGCRYLVVSRKRHMEWNEEFSEIVRKNGTNEVRIYKRDNGETGEVELYCRSTSRAAKEEAVDSLFVQRFTERMQALSAGLSKKGRTKRYDKILQRIGRLQEKYARAAKDYDIKVEKDEKGVNALSLSFKRINNKTKEYAGIYCLRTNITDWDAEKLWRTYIMLTDLESVFRSMKSELGMRPVYHQTTKRVDGHLWITLLAYHLVHHIRMRLKKRNIHDSWESLRKRMRTHIRINTTMNTGDGRTLHIRKASRPESWQLPICRALGLPSNPGGTSKTIISDRE